MSLIYVFMNDETELISTNSILEIDYEMNDLVGLSRQSSHEIVGLTLNIVNFCCLQNDWILDCKK